MKSGIKKRKNHSSSVNESMNILQLIIYTKNVFMMLYLYVMINKMQLK